MLKRESPIIVCGIARGGTRMITNLLGSHPRLFTTGELSDKFLENLVRYMETFKTISKSQKHDRRKMLLTNEKIYYKKMIKELWCVVGNRYDNIMNKKRFVHKTPGAEKYFELYSEIFFDTKPQFIYCLRSGLSVLTSVKNLRKDGVWKNNFDLKSEIERYKNSVNAYFEIKKKFPNNILLTQIDKVQNTESARKDFGQMIMDYIGEAMTDRVLKYLSEWKYVNQPVSQRDSENITPLSEPELKIIHRDSEFVKYQKAFGYVGFS